jgi:hypothetical protein
MRTERVTVLMKPEEKAAIEARAAARGVSSGEFIRLAVDNFDHVSAEEEAELAALVAEANAAIPKIRDALDRSIATLEATHKRVDAFLREAGVRK